jgi:hypothetical protein
MAGYDPRMFDPAGRHRRFRRAASLGDRRCGRRGARGLHGEGGGDTAGGGSNLADAAVAAAMRYRVGGPLIDALMAELGMTGGSLNGMLAGAGPQGDAAAVPGRLNGGAAGDGAVVDAAE